VEREIPKSNRAQNYQPAVVPQFRMPVVRCRCGTMDRPCSWWPQVLQEEFSIRFILHR